MQLNRVYVQFIIVIIAAHVVVNSAVEPEDIDTSLFDFVSYGVFEDFVDLLELTAWMGRRVKDHIDDLLENSFVLLNKQQDLLKPAMKFAEDENRKDCTEGIFMNVSEVVFREYFNLNMNCPMIGQKMSIFFNEIHNITTRITDIHKRYINRAGECGPPLRPRADRDCLQILVRGCQQETENLRDFVFMLNQDVDEFMDGQEEEAFLCTMQGMKEVRDAAKKGVNEITGCMNVDYIDFNKKYDSPLVKASMGLVKNPFERIEKILADENTNKQQDPPPFHYVMPQQPYYQPVPYYHPQMMPGQPQHQYNPQMYQPHPGMHPGPQMPQPQPQMHPGMYHPGMHPDPGMPQAYNGAQTPQNAQPTQRLPPKEAISQPPWKIDTRAPPKNDYTNNLFEDGSFEFDHNFVDEDEEHHFEDGLKNNGSSELDPNFVDENQKKHSEDGLKDEEHDEF